MAAGADATADSDAPEATAKKGADADGKKGKKAKNRKRKSQPETFAEDVPEQQTDEAQEAADQAATELAPGGEEDCMVEPAASTEPGRKSKKKKKKMEQMSAEVAEAGPSNPAQQATAIPKSPSVSELAKLGAVVDKEPTQPQKQQQKQQASAWKTRSSARGKAPAHAEGQSPVDSAALQMMPTIPSPGQADGTADNAATAAGGSNDGAKQGQDASDKGKSRAVDETSLDAQAEFVEPQWMQQLPAGSPRRSISPPICLDKLVESLCSDGSQCLASPTPEQERLLDSMLQRCLEKGKKLHHS